MQDGDIIQLGVDYQGGTEEMYRCIKMKVEVGREKRGQNNFKLVPPPHHNVDYLDVLLIFAVRASLNCLARKP